MTGEELRLRRKSRGWTQAHLGSLIGVTKNTIISYEKGNAIPDSKSEILNKVFIEDGIKDGSLKNKEEIINKDLLGLSVSMKAPNAFLLDKVLSGFHPLEIVDYLERNKERFTDLDEFRMFLKNMAVNSELENIKEQIKEIKMKIGDK